MLTVIADRAGALTSNQRATVGLPLDADDALIDAPRGAAYTAYDDSLRRAEVSAQDAPLVDVALPPREIGRRELLLQTIRIERDGQVRHVTTS